jgi:hypothetical protein
VSARSTSSSGSSRTRRIGSERKGEREIIAGFVMTKKAGEDATFCLIKDGTFSRLFV